MSDFIENIYFASPIWVQQLAVSAYGWRWYRRRFGPHFQNLVREYQSREFWSLDRFRDYQEERLKILFTAAINSPYYRQVFGHACVNRNNNQPFKILEKLPFLTKEILRSRSAELLTEDPPPKGTFVFKSSGTTGTPTEIYYSPEFHALELAVPEARNLNWASVTYKKRRVMFGVRKVCHYNQKKPPFWRFSPAENMAYASVYHLSPEYIPHYLDFLRDYCPSIVMGYPSALYTIACYALENDNLPAPVKAIFTTSETVTEKYRQIIENAWQCQIYDRYGAVENCLFASQCEYSHYHVSPEVGIIEILDSNGHPCPPGVMGEVICTGLQNTLQPLIRYRIGDVARWSSDQDCSCGRQMPILESIDGRVEDLCYTSDGRELLRFDTVFKGVDNIKEAQVVQEKMGLFTINVVPANSFGNRDIEHLKANMRLHVGDSITQVKVVESISRTQSGKFQAVICNLSEDKKNHAKSLSAK